MPRKANANKPKKITLYDVPDDVWEKIKEIKQHILSKNKYRSFVSHHEAIYRLLQRKEE